MEKAHLLLIDDEINYSELTKEYLEMRGYTLTLKHDGISGLEAFKSQSFDLCILDVKMPRKDGFTVAEEIRKIDEHIPLIFLTGQSLKEDKIKGLKIGADDYLTKPFSMEELYLRIRAILKRVQVHEKKKNKEEFHIGEFVFNSKSRELYFGGQTTKLTSIEAKLLKLFCEHENQVLSREAAMTSIWGDEEYSRGFSLNVYVSKIRKFLKEDSSIEILNLHGEGYKLVNKEKV